MSKTFSDRRAFNVARSSLALVGAALCFRLVLAAFRLQPAPQPSPARYLYVLGCGAAVEKLDTETEQRLSHLDLSAQTDLVPNPKGHLDACLANGVAYQPGQHVYTAVPTSAHLAAQDAQQYRLLAFSVPGMKFKTSVALAGLHLSDPPQLVTDGGQGVDVMAGDKDFELTSSGKLQPQTAASPDFVTELNVSGYTGADLSSFVVKHSSCASIPADVVDMSGGVALVQLTTADDRDVFAVANQKTRQVTVLQNLPQTFPQNVHLAPDGAAVLVEAAKAAPDGSELTEKTGQLMLFDAVSGKRLKDWTVPNLGAYQFLAITPNGKIAYHLGGKYRFTKGVNATYPNEPVYRRQSVGPPLFFASE